MAIIQGIIGAALVLGFGALLALLLAVNFVVEVLAERRYTKQRSTQHNGK